MMNEQGVQLSLIVTPLTQIDVLGSMGMTLPKIRSALDIIVNSNRPRRSNVDSEYETPHETIHKIDTNSITKLVRFKRNRPNSESTLRLVG